MRNPAKNAKQTKIVYLYIFCCISKTARKRRKEPFLTHICIIYVKSAQNTRRSCDSFAQKVKVHKYS